MNLKRLKIQNFLSLAHAEIRFDQEGVVLIEGLNHDSPSSLSNGAGKSSLFEALYFALYGRTKRGVAGDDVVNNVAKKNCVVELEFDDYRIWRTRKDELLGTSLRFFQIDRSPESMDGWRELSKGTVRETQQLIEERLKMSELTFSKVAYFGQGDIKGFVNLTDAELKRLFEQALGLGFFGEYQERVRSYRLGLEGALREAESHRSALERERAFALEKIALLKRSIEEQEVRVRSEAERLTTALRSAENELQALTVETRTACESIGRCLEAFEGRSSEREGLRRRKEEIDRELQEKYAAWVRLQTANAALAAEIRRMESEIAHLHDKVGRACSECGKTYQETDLTPARSNLEAKLPEKVERLQSGEAMEKEAEAAVERLQSLARELDAKVAAMSLEAAEMAQLRVQGELLEKHAKQRTRELESKVIELESLLAELSHPKPGRKPTLREELEALEIRAHSLHGEERAQAEAIERTKQETETARALEEILGNGGLKSYVFDAITPQLNRLIDRNIKILDEIDIEVSTVTRLKSGEFREKFAINVNNHHGATLFEGNSGGELQKINLAISLAINTLIRSVSETSINAIFLDEAFENLDEGSAERVLELIRTIEIPNVFLITHRPGLKELVSNVIRVEKRGGRATASDWAERNAVERAVFP